MLRTYRRAAGGNEKPKEMAKRELNEFVPENPPPNPALPIVVPKNSDKAEIDLILRQLFMLKQDTELIQKLLISTPVGASSTAGLSEVNTMDSNIRISEKSMEIVEDGYRFIRDDAIGELRIKDLEKEAIMRTLKFFNNNRRKTSRSLGMSERTLYRKIEEFGIEPKIKTRL